MIDHDMMTMEQARARIRELAAERDAAIDARLTAERDAAQLRVRAEALEAASTPSALTFVLTRSAWHLANGCDTPERARAEARRELAVVLGGGS